MIIFLFYILYSVESTNLCILLAGTTKVCVLIGFTCITAYVLHNYISAVYFLSMLFRPIISTSSICCGPPLAQLCCLVQSSTGKLFIQVPSRVKARNLHFQTQTELGALDLSFILECMVVKDFFGKCLEISTELCSFIAVLEFLLVVKCLEESQM